VNSTGVELGERLRAAGFRLKLTLVLVGAFGWLTWSLGLWLVLFALDRALRLPAGLRLPLALGAGAFTAYELFRRVLRPAWRTQTPERTAVLLERRYRLTDNLLINAVQLDRDTLPPAERAFARHTVGASQRWVARLDLRDLIDTERLLAWGGAALVTLVIWAGFALLFPHQLAVTGARFLAPLSDVPPPGDLQLTLTPATDVTLVEGESLEVRLDVRSSNGRRETTTPVIAWQEGTDAVVPLTRSGNETAPMTAAETAVEGVPALPGHAPAATGDAYVHRFSSVQRSFGFRVFAGTSCTRSVRVRVVPTPRLQQPAFRIAPPAYTGQKPQTVAGPPAPLLALDGAVIDVAFGLPAAAISVTGRVGHAGLAFAISSDRWQATFTHTQAGPYELFAQLTRGARPVPLARGEAQLLPDHPPEVDFVTDDRNRVVSYGQILDLDWQAQDDLGLASVEVGVRPADREDALVTVRRWEYMGPPGRTGPVRETLRWVVTPAALPAPGIYLLEALARDFRPGQTPGRSRPLRLQVKTESELALPDGDGLAAAFAALKATIAVQEKALRATANLRTYLDEVVRKSAVRPQVQSVAAAQADALRQGQTAQGLFRQTADGRPYAQALGELLQSGMRPVSDDLRQLESASSTALAAGLGRVERSQQNLLDRLRELLGRIAAEREQRPQLAAAGREAADPPRSKEERAREILDGVKEFLAAQERLLERSRTLADRLPEDLTQPGEDPAGELAREEERWAKFFEEKLTDFSKLPAQDFGDTSLAQELNSVFQEVKQAADALAQKKIELAVPHEQSGLENARKLENNLERWLPDAPDNIKWNMEEPLAPADIALAELPRELEDIVGELLDREETMTPEVEDATSSWLDSLDKGAGWDALDGPISSLSAKGVTGNLLPNQHEIGGRSGEGRTGRSHGQMVSDTAEGKGGRETPTRMTPEPFEPGAVKDTAKTDQGGATGGGKLSGFAGEGLRGPSPPSNAQPGPRLADRQARIRQEAEALALQLRRYRLPSGALETSVNAMTQLEAAARRSDGLAVRQAFRGALGALGEAKQTVADQVAVRNEQVRLPAWIREEIRTGVQEGVPRGYEDLVGEYFRALAEGRSGSAASQAPSPGRMGTKP
jgi:hypothetical protein